MTEDRSRVESVALIHAAGDELWKAAYEHADREVEGLYELPARDLTGDDLRWVARIVDLRDHFGVAPFTTVFDTADPVWNEKGAPVGNGINFVKLSDDDIATLAKLLDDARRETTEPPFGVYP